MCSARITFVFFVSHTACTFLCAFVVKKKPDPPKADRTIIINYEECYLAIFDNHRRSTATAVANSCTTDFTAVLFQDVDQRYNHS